MSVHPMLKLTIPSPPLPRFPRRAVPPHCGWSGCIEPIVDGETQDRHPFHCANGHPNFRSPQVVSVAVVLFGRKIALVKRGREPKMLLWCAPGGFLEWGDDTRRTALKEFGQEFFGLPPDLELGIDLDWSFLCERPGTDEMSHLFVWAAQWPGGGTKYVLPETLVHDPELPNQQRPEVLEVGLFGLGELPELAYPYQLAFFEQAIELFAA